MCLARAVTGPERFKGGTCSFGAPATDAWGLSRADSSGRYAVRRAHHRTGFVTGLWPDAHRTARRRALPSLYVWWGEPFLTPQGGTIRVTRTTVYATTSAAALPEQPSAPAEEACRARPAPVVRDLRERAGHSPHGLRFGPRDLVVVTGLPGSGKSTLMRRAVTAAGSASTARTPATAGTPAHPASSRTRCTARWSASLITPGCTAPCAPRPEPSCTTAARRPGCVAGWPAPPDAGAAPCTWCSSTSPRTPRSTASASGGAESRGTRSCATGGPAARLLRSVERGELPHGVGSAVLLDRDAADVLCRIDFAD